MADFEFECPSCGKALKIDEAHRGRRTTCPACRKAILIPARTSTAAPQPRVVPPIEAAGAAVDPLPQIEKDVFTTRPSWRSFPGTLLLAVLFPVAAVVLIFVLTAHPAVKGGIVVAGLVLGLAFFLVVLVKRYSLLYRLSTQRLFVNRGLVSRRVEEIELFRIRDIDSVQNLLERILGYGRVNVFSTDATTPKFELSGITDPLAVKDTIRTHFRNARVRERVRPTEFISDIEADEIRQHDPSL
jgi:membrane protein YdbS with pleckstrin-like domain/DNA-directed RNA polymerase subunit RPC12/RpoP